LDCIKSNLQGRDFAAGRPPSSFRIAADLFRARGLLGFYAGIIPSLMRSFLVSGSRFSAYETAIWALRDWDEPTK
jgi:solute carrier family 25 carnitine/acylcarnitine transporter 20/29